MHCMCYHLIILYNEDVGHSHRPMGMRGILSVHAGADFFLIIAISIACWTSSGHLGVLWYFGTFINVHFGVLTLSNV